MVKDKEVFLLDTNSFITPYRQYYAFDLIPSYWSELSKKFDTGRIVVLDLVKDEIGKGNDSLTEWLNGLGGLVICNHVTSEIIAKYQDVLQYIQTCGLYKERALKLWAHGYIADPWIIAAAIANHYTIITVESPSGGLSKKNPNKEAKIPDVAKTFGVKSNNLFYMMRELGIKI